MLKLDVMKAFNRLEWPFLLQVIEKAGMGNLLSRFLIVGFASASSFIMLNGKGTNPFALKRSVRQGCPLSPLLSFLVFDELGAHLQRAMKTEAIVGVNFPRTGNKEMHNFYADDCSAIIRALIRALMVYMLEFCHILDLLEQCQESYADIRMRTNRGVFHPGWATPIILMDTLVAFGGERNGISAIGDPNC